jgi:phytoene/squalene synthetase
LADEIVDTFHEHDKQRLLNEFRTDTYKAIREGISLNPILNSFQQVVRQYNIERELIDTFLHSMEMDLHRHDYSQDKYEEYILGSAEVVGLMCLKVFTNGNLKEYEKLKPFAMKLGAAFQKVNFLRDMKADFEHLGRSYFPGIDLTQFGATQKEEIENDIEADFNEALIGIKRLPKNSRLGVYLAYIYFRALFRKIKNTPSEQVMESRIRIPNSKKMALMFNSYLRHSFNLL